MTGSVRSDNHSKRDGNGNACDCSDDARVIEFVVPSYERMRDLESGVQEIVREGDMCAERARAGTDGCNNDEIFLIVTAVVILVAMCIGAYMHKSYWSFTAVIALIMAILIIIGVLTKSSCLMLCVLICAIILVVANIIHLIMLIMNARAESYFLVALIIMIGVVICSFCVCFAANNLRSAY
ncbi:unnamed protein product [Nippostrongylus brasiliensis]|uniref:Transmembrane protein n=1 Tax=Nippostrongylus brasiliensis TaxID=27835 RepID=A0A0N4Y7Y4_NIPBR|nr:hypothetical protein Q1695_013765 [Nippostrongylus brasiliensis]VDL75885.1 unnamed protein product [Nippostrongylus brasiliensis]